MKKTILVLVALLIVCIGCGTKSSKVSGTYQSEDGTQGAYVKINFTSDSEAELEIKYMLSVNAKCSYKVDGDKVTVTPKQILDDDTNEYRDITDEDLEMWDDINGDIIFTIVNDKKITTDSFDNWGEGLELTK